MSSLCQELYSVLRILRWIHQGLWLSGFYNGRQIRKLTIPLHGANCYGEEAWGVSTTKIQQDIQRRLLKAGDIWADSWWMSWSLLVGDESDLGKGGERKEPYINSTALQIMQRRVLAGNSGRETGRLGEEKVISCVELLKTKWWVSNAAKKNKTEKCYWIWQH